MAGVASPMTDFSVHHHVASHETKSMKPKLTPTFVPPLKDNSQGGTTVRIASHQTNGAYCVCEMTTLPGDGVARHVHDRDEEFYYILEGAYEMQAGDQSFTAEAGAVVVIPRDVPHQFRNAGQVPARALMIFRPGGFDELGEEMREASATGTLNAKQREAIFSKWGVHFDHDPRL
jgi:mannose-6-phosphate isomerase-like protein (cupin superfamily)